MGSSKLEKPETTEIVMMGMAEMIIARSSQAILVLDSPAYDFVAAMATKHL